MTAIIGQIIQGFKGFLSQLEEMSKYAVSELQRFGIAAAQKIQVLMAAALREIKEKISRLIKAARTKIENLNKQRSKLSPGPAGASFGSKVKNALSAAARRAEGVTSKFKDSAISLLKEVKEILARIGSTTFRGVKGLSRITKDATVGIFSALKNVGEGAIKEVKGFTEGFTHELEVAGDFVYKHGIQVAEAATITILSPSLIIGVLAAAGVVVISHQQFIKPLEDGSAQRDIHAQNLEALENDNGPLYVDQDGNDIPTPIRK